jgi:hypothetical protein
MPCRDCSDIGEECDRCFREVNRLCHVEWHDESNQHKTASICEKCLRKEKCKDCQFSIEQCDKYEWSRIETRSTPNTYKFYDAFREDRDYFCPLNVSLKTGELATCQDDAICILLCKKCAQKRIHQQFEVWRYQNTMEQQRPEPEQLSLIESIGSDLTNAIFSYLEFPKSMSLISLVCRTWNNFVANELVIENFSFASESETYMCNIMKHLLKYRTQISKLMYRRSEALHDITFPSNESIILMLLELCNNATVNEIRTETQDVPIPFYTLLQLLKNTDPTKPIVFRAYTDHLKDLLVVTNDNVTDLHISQTLDNKLKLPTNLLKLSLECLSNDIPVLATVKYLEIENLSLFDDIFAKEQLPNVISIAAPRFNILRELSAVYADHTDQLQEIHFTSQDWDSSGLMQVVQNCRNIRVASILLLDVSTFQSMFDKYDSLSSWTHLHTLNIHGTRYCYTMTKKHIPFLRIIAPNVKLIRFRCMPKLNQNVKEMLLKFTFVVEEKETYGN